MITTPTLLLLLSLATATAAGSLRRTPPRRLKASIACNGTQFSARLTPHQFCRLTETSTTHHQVESLCNLYLKVHPDEEHTDCVAKFLPHVVHSCDDQPEDHTTYCVDQVDVDHLGDECVSADPPGSTSNLDAKSRFHPYVDYDCVPHATHLLITTADIVAEVGLSNLTAKLASQTKLFVLPNEPFQESEFAAYEATAQWSSYERVGLLVHGGFDEDSNTYTLLGHRLDATLGAPEPQLEAVVRSLRVIRGMDRGAFDIFACDVGQGVAFRRILADVDALLEFEGGVSVSTDVTGHSGNWNLEWNTHTGWRPVGQVDETEIQLYLYDTELGIDLARAMTGRRRPLYLCRDDYAKATAWSRELYEYLEDECRCRSPIPEKG